jgi:hypothetical protein
MVELSVRIRCSNYPVQLTGARCCVQYQTVLHVSQEFCRRAQFSQLMHCVVQPSKGALDAASAHGSNHLVLRCGAPRQACRTPEHVGDNGMQHACLKTQLPDQQVQVANLPGRPT